MNTPLDTEQIRSLLVSASPGEWLAADPHFPDVPRVVNQWHYTIAEVAGHGWDTDTERANAALIAAAPALILSLCDALDEARATLANERGEGEAPGVGWGWTTTAHLTGLWFKRTKTNESIVQRTTSRGWYWTDYDHGFSLKNIYPTARAAMIAADKARSPA